MNGVEAAHTHLGVESRGCWCYDVGVCLITFSMDTQRQKKGCYRRLKGIFAVLANALFSGPVDSCFWLAELYNQ